MFDRYFNSWFSGDLVVGTFGPTVWGQFKKMLSKSKRFNFVSQKFSDKFQPYFSKKNLSVEGMFNAKGEPIGPNDFWSKFKPVDNAAGNEKAFFEIGGDDYFRNLKKTKLKDKDLGGIYKELFIDQKITSGGKYASLEDAMFAPEGVLGKITSYDERLAIAEYTKVGATHAQITGQIQELTKPLMDASNKTAEEAARDLILAQRLKGKIWLNTDDAFNMDLKDSFKKLTDSDLKNLIVEDPLTKLKRPLLDRDDKYIDDIFENFVKKGNYNEVSRVSKNAAGNISVYRFRPEGKSVGIVDIDKVEKGLYDPDFQVLFRNGQYYPATPFNAELIREEVKHGTVYLFRGGFEEFGEFSPLDLAQRMAAGGVMDGKVNKFVLNMPQLYDSMIARDYVKGRYGNVLSKGLQAQEKLFTNYAKVWQPNVLQSGIGWTGKMYAYWWMNRGFGFDEVSLYQLPEEWTEVQFEPGTSEFYNDAYIDFFANEGSDTGDLFQKVISNLPVPWIIDQFVEKNKSIEGWWERFNGEVGRSHPENLAMFLFGSQACPDCSAVITSPVNERFDVQFSSTESTNSFFLEHQKTKEAKDDGQFLQVFAHHTNVKGQLKGEELDEINLIKAQEEGTTCQKVMDNLIPYGPVSRIIGAEKIGGFLALTENVAYLSGGMTGALFTTINQLAVAPQMNECVDDKEGYFASLYVPNNDDDKAGKTDELQKSVTEDALDGIREFSNEIDRNRTGQSLTDNVLKEATSKVRELVDDAQDDRVAEAELRITGSSSGYVRSEEVMYFWVGGGSLVEPTRYLTEGKTLLTTEDGHTITVDNSTGTIVVDGKEVIGEDKEDHVRLTNKNLAIPTMEVPQRINGFALEDSNALLLTMNVRGETLVQDPALLDCLQSAVMEQSGVPLNSNNMGEAFGQGQSVTTDAFPSISIDPINNRIQLGGQVPQTAFGAGASVQLYGNRRVVVTGAAFPEAGNFQSASFENGTLVYKPQTHELLIWLRHHEAAIVSDEDVKGFNGNLTTTINPNTQCEEPAIDLSVETDPNSPAAKLKGDNLTAGLAKNGPFQVFETPTKQFILYSKLVDGECKDFFKVINKETGEVYDQEISSITQGEDGSIKIITADGQTHSLQFSDQNGKPVLTYDGQSELLNSASGKGGSFYYDPNKGLYYAENAQLIPLNDNFRNQGIGFQANPDGSVSGKASDNVFNINTGQGADSLFNIPSIPEDLAGAAVVLLLLLGGVLGLYVDSRRKKNTWAA
jgi:hypothetical protein